MAVAKIIGRNVLEREEFDDEVRMWVFQEQVDGKNLTDIINTEHENVKYLPVRCRSINETPRGHRKDATIAAAALAATPMCSCGYVLRSVACPSGHPSHCRRVVLTAHVPHAGPLALTLPGHQVHG